MTDHNKILKKLTELPWNGILWSLSASFIVSTLAVNVVSYILMPTGGQPGSYRSSASNTSMIPSGGITLSGSELKKIYDRNIFNKEGKLGDVENSGDVDKPTVGDALVKSTLPVKVMGIIYAGTPYNGLASISNTKKNKVNSFMVGDFLLKAKVVEIHRNRVILLRNGRREYIELERKEIVRSSRVKKKAKSTPNKISPIAKGPALSSYKEDGFSRDGNKAEMSEGYKEKLLGSDLPKVLQDAKATPNMVDGQVKGFRLTRIREGSIYQKAGFQNDDVVEEINGVPLTNAAAAIRLLQSLRNENEIDVAISRGGSRFSMTLEVR